MRIFLWLTMFLTSLAQAAELPLAKTSNDKSLKWGPCPELFPKGCEISMLYEGVNKKNSDIYFKVPGNYSIPAHTHTSAEHMTLVSGNLKVKYKGQAEVTLLPGSYAFGPAHHPHEAKCISEESCVLFISFDEPIDATAFTGSM